MYGGHDRSAVNEKLCNNKNMKFITGRVTSSLDRAGKSSFSGPEQIRPWASGSPLPSMLNVSVRSRGAGPRIWERMTRPDKHFSWCVRTMSPEPQAEPLVKYRAETRIEPSQVKPAPNKAEPLTKPEPGLELSRASVGSQAELRAEPAWSIFPNRSEAQ